MQLRAPHGQWCDLLNSRRVCVISIPFLAWGLSHVRTLTSMCKLYYCSVTDEPAEVEKYSNLLLKCANFKEKIKVHALLFEHVMQNHLSRMHEFSYA